MLLPAAAAAMLETTEATLRRWRRNGHGPVFLRIGRKIRYKREDIEAWIDSQRNVPSKPKAAA